MQKYISTLSCNLKCLRFLSMIHNKIVFGLLIMSFLGACATPSAMLGPIYTFTSTGSIAQTSISIGSNELITMHTGKTPIENIKEFVKTENEDKNIHKDTLESEEFYILVKNKIENNKIILNQTNQ